MKTFTARELNRDVSAAKREASREAAVITDRGEPAFVLLSFEEYKRLGESGTDLAERLSMSDDIDIEFAPLTLDLKVPEL
ncbi:type II toxin-antitoxin system Phd/YefM family antitoxin [Leucobacter insecticola]|uniref:Antitoxin n=2 Tax=Leucobacter insecticola TaxID=2714934 RepID=A0A6G8FM46_9MICO|nr:type II toxin-antitoxin system Phd/YefM family antitoxin [Leucobacter insecticola]